MAIGILPSLLLSPPAAVAPMKCSSTTSSSSSLPRHHKNKTISITSSSSSSSCSIKSNNNKQALVNFTRRETTIGFLGLLCLKQLLDEPASAVAEEPPSNTPCEFTVADSGLAFCDKLVGSGSEPQKGQLIKAHYVGKLENGKVFDSSYNRGKPLTFRIGVGEVIKGWDQGILGGDGVPPMLAGGKRRLKLPPQLGYGMRGAGCRGGSCIIPPDSVLLFDVEFIGKG